jgi:hypothetical protein
MQCMYEIGSRSIKPSPRESDDFREGSRETREGPLSTVETEPHGDSKYKGSFLVWFVGLVVPLKEFFAQPYGL